jgi:lysophospholipase L1-like esterase
MDISQNIYPKAPAATVALLPLNSRIVAMGDSLTASGIAVISPTRSSYQSRGYTTYAAIKSDNKFYMPIDGNKGVSGNTTTDMVNRLGAALALNPAVAIVLGGTNDLGTSATSETIINNLRRLHNGFIAVRARVIAITIFPRFGANAPTPANEIKRLEVNTWIRQQASDNLIVIDAETLMNDAGYYYDGLHLNSVGAAIMGGAVADILNGLIKAGKVSDVLAVDNAYNLNLYFAGTTGVKTNGATGIVATSYELDRGSSGAAVEGVVLNENGLRSQQINITGTYTGTNQIVSLRNNSTVNPPLSGDIMEAFADFKFITNDPNIVGVNVTYFVYTSTFAQLARADSLLALDQISNTMSADKVYTLRTPSVAVGSTGAPSRVAMEFTVLLREAAVATAINASLVVYKIGTRKVPSVL